MKKSKKRNYVIIALLVVLLFLAVGYAAFSQNLTLSGSVAGTGTWDIHWGTAAVNPASYSANGVQISSDGLTVTVNDLKLGYPGDACTIDLTIVNEGTLDAKLTSLEVQNTDGTAYANDNIKITTPNIAGETLAAGKTCELKVAVAWDENSTAETASADFKIVFNYDQSATVKNVDASHKAH